MTRLAEWVVYEKLLHTDVNHHYFSLARRLLTSDVSVTFGGHARYKGPTLRFSGDMTTSLGNTINNICCIAAARWHASGRPRVDWVEFVSRLPLVAEGDDSIQALSGLEPQLITDALTALGLRVKPLVVDSIGDSGYCGVCTDSTATRLYCRDVVTALAKASWAPGDANRLERLALKAQSLCLQYPNMPLVAGFVRLHARDIIVTNVRLDQYEVE